MKISKEWNETQKNLSYESSQSIFHVGGFGVKHTGTRIVISIRFKSHFQIGDCYDQGPSGLTTHPDLSQSR